LRQGRDLCLSTGTELKPWHPTKRGPSEGRPRSVEVRIDQRAPRFEEGLKGDLGDQAAGQGHGQRRLVSMLARPRPKNRLRLACEPLTMERVSRPPHPESRRGVWSVGQVIERTRGDREGGLFGRREASRQATRGGWTEEDNSEKVGV
jgi:hypothetical protein